MHARATRAPALLRHNRCCTAACRRSLSAGGMKNRQPVRSDRPLPTPACVALSVRENSRAASRRLVRRSRLPERVCCSAFLLSGWPAAATRSPHCALFLYARSHFPSPRCQLPLSAPSRYGCCR
ncbi:hypothetical protein MRX96_040813 [Rhipicephalus microplus]